MASFSRPLFPSDPPPKATLKLFAPGDGEPDAPPAAGDLAPDCTLSEFYEAFFLPVRLTGADKKTLKEDRTTLGKWRSYCGAPPLEKIDRVLLAGFVDWLQSKGLGVVTCAKHLARVQTFLRAAGPDSGDGLCAELLGKVVRIKPPRTPTREPDKAFRLAEIAAWLDACHHAPKLRGVSCAPAWWQSIVLFDFCCPLRFEALTAARWEWLKQLTDLPGWWLKCSAAADKKDHERTYCVSSHALAALEILAPEKVSLLRAGESVTGEIFGLPLTPARLYAHARAILARSAITAARREQRVFHGLRAAADTELRKLGYPVAAKRALGRSVGRDVDMGFYTGLAEYAAAMERLPQPSFTRWREPQLRLF